jgi:hypothetical protein
MSFESAAKALLWTGAVVIAVYRPLVGQAFFLRLETLARRGARHPWIVCLAFALLVLLIRGALLPWWPIPRPVIWDEFGYILQADTFAHGRLTNPTHPLWPFFESVYILQHPTYTAKYPPGQALALAAGQVLFEDPWFGVWLSCALMAAALVWAMEAWLPPGWALFGGILAIPLAITSYWMNGYWGGAVAAIGGALLLGGFGRVVKRNQPWYGLAMGLGLALLANTRPYEGLVFSIPVAIAFLLSRPRWSAVASIALVLIPAFAATAFYNRAVTGNPFQLPFTEYARQYARIPLFNFQSLQPARTDLNPFMADMHEDWEVGEWKKSRSWQLIPVRLRDWKTVATILFSSFPLSFLMVLFLPNLWRDRRIRLPLLCVFAALAGSWIEVRYYVHYAAPAAAAFFIVLTQSFRHLRHWKIGNEATGVFLTRALPVIVVGSALVAQAITMLPGHKPPEAPNARRDRVAGLLDNVLERHVILVRYTTKKDPHEEWVYNGADIDSQGVIWAHDLGEEKNKQLVDYYKDRKIWLFQPDIDLSKLTLYGTNP